MQLQELSSTSNNRSAHLYYEDFPASFSRQLLNTIRCSHVPDEFIDTATQVGTHTICTSITEIKPKPGFSVSVHLPLTQTRLLPRAGAVIASLMMQIVKYGETAIMKRCQRYHAIH